MSNVIPLATWPKLEPTEKVCKFLDDWFQRHRNDPPGDLIGSCIQDAVREAVKDDNLVRYAAGLARQFDALCEVVTKAKKQTQLAYQFTPNSYAYSGRADQGTRARQEAPTARASEKQ